MSLKITTLTDAENIRAGLKGTKVNLKTVSITAKAFKLSYLTPYIKVIFIMGIGTEKAFIFKALESTKASLITTTQPATVNLLIRSDIYTKANF